MKKYDDDAIKIKNICNQAQKEETSFWTTFLDPLQQKKLDSALKNQGVEHSFFGGYPGAERKLLHVSASWDFEEEKAPISALVLDVATSATHRDLLGALLATGIKRDQIGDLLVAEGKGIVFLLQTMALYVKNNLDSIRGVAPHVEIVPLEDVSIPEPTFRVESLVLSSLRLDNLVAKACRLPRTEGALLVEKGFVKVDHEIIAKSAAPIEPGQLISVRGHGRFLLQVDEGRTKKGNFKAEIHWFE